VWLSVLYSISLIPSYAVGSSVSNGVQCKAIRTSMGKYCNINTQDTLYTAYLHLPRVIFSLKSSLQDYKKIYNLAL